MPTFLQRPRDPPGWWVGWSGGSLKPSLGFKEVRFLGKLRVQDSWHVRAPLLACARAVIGILLCSRCRFQALRCFKWSGDAGSKQQVFAHRAELKRSLSGA